MTTPARPADGLTQDELFAALHDLVWRIEACGASIELTNAVTLCSDIRAAMGNKWNPADAQAAQRVLSRKELTMPQGKRDTDGPQSEPHGTLRSPDTSNRQRPADGVPEEPQTFYNVVNEHTREHLVAVDIREYTALRDALEGAQTALDAAGVAKGAFGHSVRYRIGLLLEERDAALLREKEALAAVRDADTQIVGGNAVVWRKKHAAVIASAAGEGRGNG